MVDLFVRQAKNYDFHDDIYGFYAHRLWVRSLLKVVKDFMRSKKQADMLDLACGTGFVTYNIASRYENIDIDGLDLSPHMLEVAKERKEQGFKNRNIKFWVGDSEVPFGENKYDIITVSFAWRKKRRRRESFTETRAASRSSPECRSRHTVSWKPAIRATTSTSSGPGSGQTSPVRRPQRRFSRKPAGCTR